MAVRVSNAVQQETCAPASDSGSTARTIEDLQALGVTDAEDNAALQRVAERFSIAVTPAMLDLIDPADADDPISRQFVPNTNELIEHPLDRADPIGDNQHSPIKGIVHRYPDRALLMPVKICPVYCRFCFRRESVGNAEDGLLSEPELQAALDYIRDNDSIWEVILSGGDPLILSPRRLKQILAALSNIEHVEVIRIHTRVPVVDPDRINKLLINALATHKALFVVLHSNHPRELTETARNACAQLIDNGIPMLSQTVLLKGINDDPSTLEQLLRKLVANRIKPYYLHHADRAPGTAHFRTRLDEGQALIKSLRGKVSGLCQPEYVLDIPGGHGKVPVSQAWLRHSGDATLVTSPMGKSIRLQEE